MRRRDCLWNNTYNAYAIHTDDIVGDTALGKQVEYPLLFERLDIFTKTELLHNMSGLCPQIGSRTY